VVLVPEGGVPKLKKKTPTEIIKIDKSGDGLVPGKGGKAFSRGVVPGLKRTCDDRERHGGKSGMKGVPESQISQSE